MCAAISTATIPEGRVAMLVGGKVQALAFSPDGKFMAACTRDHDGCVTIWPTNSLW
jgi:hypothetical protein